MSAPLKRYLGDGAYVAYDGQSLILTAEDGLRATDTVVLDSEGFQALLDFVQALRATRTAPRQPSFWCGEHAVAFEGTALCPLCEAEARQP